MQMGLYIIPYSSRVVPYFWCPLSCDPVRCCILLRFRAIPCGVKSDRFIITGLEPGHLGSELEPLIHSAMNSPVRSQNIIYVYLLRLSLTDLIVSSRPCCMIFVTMKTSSLFNPDNLMPSRTSSSFLKTQFINKCT